MLAHRLFEYDRSVQYKPSLAAVAELIANPARAAMLERLRDGVAYSAGELAREGGVASSTGSSHLAKLVDGGLVSLEVLGRHRRFRLAGPVVVRALESLAVLATQESRPSRCDAGRDAQLRSGRTCYDHLAGQLGVALTEALVAQRVLIHGVGTFDITPAGVRRFAALGIAVGAARAARRGFALECLDWSERRVHLGGALGAALCSRVFALGWIKRAESGRVVIVTEEGRRGLLESFGYPISEVAEKT